MGFHKAIYDTRASLGQLKNKVDGSPLASEPGQALGALRSSTGRKDYLAAKRGIKQGIPS